MKRLYILTRNDLGLAYQAVQGAHAVAQFCLDYPDNEWKNGYLIFLAVEDHAELQEWWGLLNLGNELKPEHKHEPLSVFHEPDLDNEMTALAMYTKGSKFKKLPIMQNNNINYLLPEKKLK